MVHIVVSPATMGRRRLLGWAALAIALVGSAMFVRAQSGATTPAQQATREEFAPRPDVSDQDWPQLVPKLLALFNNNREQLGRALGLHRSTVDRWLNGKSRPNTSTILRMRRLAQERRVE